MKKYYAMLLVAALTVTTIPVNTAVADEIVEKESSIKDDTAEFERIFISEDTGSKVNAEATSGEITETPETDSIGVIESASEIIDNKSTEKEEAAEGEKEAEEESVVSEISQEEFSKKEITEYENVSEEIEEISILSENTVIKEEEKGDRTADDIDITDSVMSGSCGENLSWELTGFEGSMTLTISGSGAMTDYSNSQEIPWYNHISDITTISMEKGITHIGDYAFARCGNYRGWNYDVKIPEGVVSIGKDASSDSEYTAISLPSTIKKIGISAFEWTKITAITLPDGLEKIKR